MRHVGLANLNDANDHKSRFIWKVRLQSMRGSHEEGYVEHFEYVQRTRSSNRFFEFSALRYTNLAGELLRSRNRVCLRLVRIIRDTRITGLVRTRKADKVGRLGASTATDLQLMAARIELSTGVLVRCMKRQDFMANEVVARSNALGNRVFHEAARLLNDVCAPDVGSACAAFFLDFEPYGATEVLV